MFNNGLKTDNFIINKLHNQIFGEKVKNQKGNSLDKKLRF